MSEKTEKKVVYIYVDGGVVQEVRTDADVVVKVIDFDEPGDETTKMAKEGADKPCVY